jgi:hypothetical protein
VVHLVQLLVQLTLGLVVEQLHTPPTLMELETVVLVLLLLDIY